MGFQQGDWLVPLIRAFCLTRGPFGGLSFWSHKHVDRTCIVRLGFSMRRFNYRWLYLFLVFPLFSFADDYVWRTPANPGIYSTPTAACKSFEPVYPFKSLKADTATRFSCVSDATVIGVPQYIYGYVTRSGTGCPVDSTYNAATGECLASNPCAAKTGGSQNFAKSGQSGDGYGSVVGGFVVSSQSACFQGCAVSTADQKCTGRVSGKYTCRGTAYFSGQSCSTSGSGSEVQDNTSNEPKPDPQIIVDDKPCVYSGSGETQSCVSEKTNEKEGQHCGTVNGVKTCVDSKPTKDGIKIDTTVKTVTNPDGSKVTTKTDVSTKTNCTGAGQCTSTSTTTTTTTNTSSSGVTTGSTGSCTGAACPDKNTNPDGDGDGFGDCTGDDCGDEPGEGGPSDFYQAGDDTYASVIEAFADSVSQIPVVAGVDNFLTFTPSGACPVYTVDTWVFSVRLDQWCTGSTIPWELIKAVILACCGFYAFRIAFT